MRAVMICHNAHLAQVVLNSLKANGVKTLPICNRATTKSPRVSGFTDGILLGADLTTCAAEAARPINRQRRCAGVDFVLSSHVQGAVLAGWRRIFTGRWPLWQLRKGMREAANDPLSLLLWRLGYDALS